MKAARNPQSNKPAAARSANHRAPDSTGPEVLTLSETAAYLRVPEEAVRELATSEKLPAQKIGGEWRFLKRAVADWLGRGTAPKPGSREAVLRAFGAFRDEDDLEEQLAALRAIRKASGR